MTGDRKLAEQQEIEERLTKLWRGATEPSERRAFVEAINIVRAVRRERETVTPWYQFPDLKPDELQGDDQRVTVTITVEQRGKTPIRYSESALNGVANLLLPLYQRAQGYERQQDMTPGGVVFRLLEKARGKR